jgi:transposase InsO family protein
MWSISYFLRWQKLLLTCTDYFSKWCTATAIPDKQATTVDDALIRDVFCIYGSAFEIISDQGTEFDNALLHNLCIKLHIAKTRTSAYQPNTNGVAERVHKTLNSMMGRVIEENHSHWTDHLPFIMAAYRSAVHRSTGYSPNFHMFGREVYTPLDILIKAPSTETVHSDTYVDKQLELLSDAYWRVRENLNTSVLTNKRFYDEAAHRLTFSVGDWVWFYKPRQQTGKYPRWSRYYSGPFRIMKRLGEVNYVIQQRSTSAQIVTHVDKLKKYEGPEPDDWTVTHNTNRVLQTSSNHIETNDPAPQNDRPIR